MISKELTRAHRPKKVDSPLGIDLLQLTSSTGNIREKGFLYPIDSI
jgi:hypothetical protein